MNSKIADINIDPTLCNKYANEDQEFIFCTKGRPFGCLISPHLPTPTSTLIDYNLVRDAGMKMSDLQQGHSVYNHTEHFLGSLMEKQAKMGQNLISCHIESSTQLLINVSKHPRPLRIMLNHIFKNQSHKTRNEKLTFLA